MTVKEESEKAGLKLSTQKTKILAFGPIISWQIDEEIVSYYFLGLQNHCGQAKENREWGRTKADETIKHTAGWETIIWKYCYIF